LENWEAALKNSLDMAQSAGGNLLEESKSKVPNETDSSQSPDTPQETERTIENIDFDLRKAVLRGDSDGVADLISEIIEAGAKPETLVENSLAATLEVLGDAFERGEAFLPQMIIAAEAMKSGVARIKEYLPKGSDHKAGTVIFCTVKGDIHSIGKDICVNLLESQGFEVINLGVDVASERVIEAAVKHNADVVCLSALMTTSLKQMQATVEAVYRELPEFKSDPKKAVCVGGAVVTESWANKIGAAYSADAPRCVELIFSILK
jgi:5-methyltetrahydrofolate--homocysteine methyltransferase